MHTPIKDNMWKGQRCFIVGGGPSLKGFDWSKLDGELTIGCNLAFEAFDPCMIVAVDKRFYQWILWGEYEEKHPGLRQRFLDLNVGKYLIYPAETLNNFYSGIDIITRNKTDKLATSLADGVLMGSNTGLAAVNLAICLGASEIYLLGFDMCGDGSGKQAHFHAGHPTKQDENCYNRFIDAFGQHAGDMNRHARIVNLNPDSKLPYFPKLSWAEAGIEPKKRPLLVNYHTGGPYALEAKEMERTARLFGLKPFIQERDSAGSWRENCYQKIDFMRECLERFDKPMIWTDADGRYRMYPVKFDEFAEQDDVDMALIYISWAQFGRKFGVEINASSIGFRRTPKTEAILAGWKEHVELTEPVHDQAGLYSYLIKDTTPNIALVQLPPSYAYIANFMKNAQFEPIIEQTQASRLLKKQMTATLQSPVPSPDPAPTIALTPRERPLHVLVTGPPRSGTSLLYNMLCYAYPSFGHAQGERTALSDLKLEGDRISKHPFDLLALNDIKETAKIVGKDLKVICILRDFRDVVTSFTRDRYIMGFDAYTNKANRPLPGIFELLRGLESAMCDDDIFCTTIQYELLVKNTIAVQNFIAALLGEESPFSFKNFLEDKNPGMHSSGEMHTKPLTESLIGRWQEPKHKARIIEQFESQEARDLLRMYGYTRTDEWYGQLVAGSEVIPLELAHQLRLSVAASPVIQIGRPRGNQYDLGALKAGLAG